MNLRKGFFLQKKAQNIVFFLYSAQKFDIQEAHLLFLRYNFILLLAALTLVACGSSENSTTSQNSDEGTVQLYGAKVATSAAKLPTCDSNQVGQLFYVLDDEKFQFCSNEGYQSIDLNGDSGADGKNGANGKDGTNGKDGSSCSVIENTNGSKTILCEDGSSATVNDGASCTVDDNGEGSYDLTCSGTKVTVRDGVDGADGVSCLASKSNDSLFVDCNGVLDTIVDGQNGENGADGSSCTISDDNAGTLTQTCTDGTSASWPKALCGTKPYDPATHFCEAGTVLELCGDLTYDPATHFCNEGTVLDLCGGLTYDPAMELCEAGTVMKFCGDLTYDPTTHFCDEETTTPMLSWSAHCLVPGNCGTFSDSRETPAKQYKWTKIGTQTWMAENLAYLPSVNAKSDESTSEAKYYVYDYDGESVATAKATSNYTNYGVLYNWPAAMAACPTGWHLPSTWDFTTLYSNVGGVETAGTKLKSVSSWTEGGDTETDSYGFSALPGGYFLSYDGFFDLLDNGSFWMTTEKNASYAYYQLMEYSMATMHSVYYEKDAGFSVRCLKD